MSLADLIHPKTQSEAVANANPAIPATTQTLDSRNVATVAVANPSEAKNEATHSDLYGTLPLDDRRTCPQCLNLAQSGLCLASHRGMLPQTSRNNHPSQERLYRCVGYLPNASDDDRRPGRERWPSLVRKD